MMVALFVLGGGAFALPVEGIVHIVPAVEPHLLPLLRPGVVGVLVDQEEVIPIFDLAVCGVGAGSCVSPALYVVYEAEAGRVAVPADRVLQMVGSDQGVIRSAEVDGFRTGLKQAFLFQGREFPLLDVDELVTAPCAVKSTISSGIEEA